MRVRSGVEKLKAEEQGVKSAQKPGDGIPVFARKITLNLFS